MNIILATQNRGKVEEFKRIFTDCPVKLSSIFDYGITLEPEETGSTFSENAQIKLEYYLETLQKNKYYDSSQKNLLLAEDSGIEIKALNGEPGVLSARYGGEGLDSADRNNLILKKMKDVAPENRKARFVCCIKVAYIETDIVYEFIEYSEGIIMDDIYGSKGFGYDPIFKPLGYNVSMGSLEPEIKDKISHRGLASKKLIKKILDER
ncbi:MAG: non-canonical purine NTP pyrophosphatase [Chloroflexi bacterium]|nr:non-canonical purine NTP pyrophosphatase [Chloroflexota bacterium]|tara:strand:- start:4198 stop:4821 length:624 start_codon:yes stop_codon:yes gene_type:complete